MCLSTLLYSHKSLIILSLCISQVSAVNQHVQPLKKICKSKPENILWKIPWARIVFLSKNTKRARRIKNISPCTWNEKGFNANGSSVRSKHNHDKTFHRIETFYSPCIVNTHLGHSNRIKSGQIPLIHLCHWSLQVNQDLAYFGCQITFLFQALEFWLIYGTSNSTGWLGAKPPVTGDARPSVKLC